VKSVTVSYVGVVMRRDHHMPGAESCGGKWSAYLRICGEVASDKAVAKTTAAHNQRQALTAGQLAPAETVESADDLR